MNCPGFEPSNISPAHCRHCHRTDLEHDRLTEALRELALAVALEAGFIAACFRSLPAVNREGAELNTANEKLRKGFLDAHAKNYGRLRKLPQFKRVTFLEFTIEMFVGAVRSHELEGKKAMRKALKEGFN